METTQQRLRRALYRFKPIDGLQSRQTQTTNQNDYVQLRPDNEAGGGVEAATDLPHLRSTPPSLASTNSHQPSMPPDNSSVNGRWAGIRQRAEIRRREAEIRQLTESRPTGQAAEQSDEETSDADSIATRVARIQARLAELTGNAENKVPVSTERRQERPLTLDTRRLTVGNTTTPSNIQPAPDRNDIYTKPVDIDGASSGPPATQIVEKRTSSANGHDLTRIEQDPFCKPWYSSSILERILFEMDVESVRSALLSLKVTDLWLPLSRQLLKRSLNKRSLNDPHHVSEFLRLQDEHLKSSLARWTQPISGEHIPKMMFSHCEFEDDEEIFEENRMLGEGMVGLVEEVTVRSREPPIVCVRKKMARPKQLKAHQQIMAAFIREVGVMRQVNHRHCVRFLGSYTDNESVNILSTPVADMDLAAFLDKPIGDQEWAILYKGIDCLCNGLLYLHDNKIRHEDLKPQNVLVHGTNILLTDFGFSLDFSDDSVSTTTGRPSAWTIRYSAPEVLDCEPRNRASDIFSLGCILIEMVSGLYGYSLSEVKDHWKKTGNGQSSFARNTEATSSWLASLSDHPISGRIKPIVDYLPALLITKRLDRPSAQAVVDRLGKLSQLHPDPPHHVNTCCGSPPGLMDNLRPGRVEGSGLLGTLDPSFLPDVRRYFDAVADTGMSYIVLDHYYNHVTSKHAYKFCFRDTPRVTLDGGTLLIVDFAAIKNACALLLSESIRERPVLDQARSPNDPRATLYRKIVLLPRILQMYTSCQAIFTALRAKVYIPESVLQQNDPYLLSMRTRTIQIAMVDYGRNPHGERCFDAVFYVLAFSIFDVGYDPSSLGAPFVDLARTSSN